MDDRMSFVIALFVKSAFKHSVTPGTFYQMYIHCIRKLTPTFGLRESSNIKNTIRSLTVHILCVPV